MYEMTMTIKKKNYSERKAAFWAVDNPWLTDGSRSTPPGPRPLAHPRGPKSSARTIIHPLHSASRPAYAGSGTGEAVGPEPVST